jgi:hypothetical protein
VRREPIARVPDVNLGQGHLLIHVQEATVRRDLASAGRKRLEKRHRELRGRAENAGGESRYDGRDQRSVGEKSEHAAVHEPLWAQHPVGRPKGACRRAVRGGDDPAARQPGYRRCGRAPGEQRLDLLPPGERGESRIGHASTHRLAQEVRPVRHGGSTRPQTLPAAGATTHDPGPR